MKEAVIKWIRNYPRLERPLEYFVKPVYTNFHYQIVKGRLRQFYHHITTGHIVRFVSVRSYINSHNFRKLQIGGGYHTKNGWLNGDLIAGDIYLDAARKFPFPAEFFDRIFAEHFIEHLSLSQGFFCLRECFRVLKRHGKIRLSTPDLEQLCSLYKNLNSNIGLETAMECHRKSHNKELTTACHFINDSFRLWGHSFIYDEKTLGMQLEQAGLSNISRLEFGCSDDKELVNLERHAEAEWMKGAFPLILEAEKT